MNTRNCRLSLSVIVAAVLLWPAFSQEKKPILGIKTFENPPNYYNSTIGTGLTDLFVTELHKTGKYTIIERAAVDELVKEVDFGKSGYVDQKTAVRKGNIKGVEFYFFGKVTNFGAEQKKTGLGGIGGRVFGGLGARSDRANVRIDFRIVDATTGETLLAEYGAGESKQSGLSFDGGVFGSGAGAATFQSREFLDSMVGKATLAALSQCVEKMGRFFPQHTQSAAAQIKEKEAEAREAAMEALQSAPGKILAVPAPEVIIISLGKAQGLQNGDTLTVYQEIHTKDTQGNIVYTEEKLIGQIILVDVQQDRSKAQPSSGTGFAEGQIIKRK